MSIELLGTGRTDHEPWMGPVAARYRLHRLTPGEALDDGVAARVRGMVSGGGYTVDAALLARLPMLGVVAVTGAGYDRVDVGAARTRAIQVCNAPGTTDRCVADMAIGLLLAVVRGIVRNDRFVRAGSWLERRPPVLPRFSGRRLGIYGLGRIGMQVARRALAFDMAVHYHNRRPRADVPYRYHPSLHALADAVDDLVVCCPATEETRGSVDRAVLERLGPAGVLVNVARGSIVDEPALVEALESRTIAGAGLDVFADEPYVPPALLALDNVVLSPHVAGGTLGTWEDVVEAVLANLDAYFRDGRVLNPVAP